MPTKRGVVTSAKSTGTVTVTVHRSVMHPKYQKRFRVSKKFLVDTAGQNIAEGDEVEIGETRPISKRKHFKITSIVKKAAEESRMQVAEEPGFAESYAEARSRGKSSKKKKNEETSSPQEQ